MIEEKDPFILKVKSNNQRTLNINKWNIVTVYRGKENSRRPQKDRLRASEETVGNTRTGYASPRVAQTRVVSSQHLCLQYDCIPKGCPQALSLWCVSKVTRVPLSHLLFTPKPVRTMGHYKSQPDTDEVCSPKQLNHGLAVCTWKDRRTPTLLWESGRKKCGDLSEIYGNLFPVNKIE